ncbi:MAG TPA: metal transporter [Thermohalobaculum sp.]|nr:metal transporter [Thermohalobaculum sp.]
MSDEIGGGIRGSFSGSIFARWIWLALPALGLAVILAVILIGRPLEQLSTSAPPVEELAVESVTLTPGMISLALRADGSGPVTVAQTQVDGAYRAFTAAPAATIGRLASARINIPYPWIEGETHHLLLVASTGATFEHTIEVAVPSLAPIGVDLVGMILIGLFLGIAPVAAGLLAFPAIRDASDRTMGFILALTIGLLGYLFIDTISEGLEVASGALDRLRAGTLVWVSAAATALVLVAIGRRGGRPPAGAALATFIALGIGVHNFGEGLAVGAALSTGAAALATFLVVGFAIHNVSEGIAILVPLASGRPRLATFAGLAALAGLPAVPGVILGAAAISPYWTALCFGVGAGSILQVIIEVAALLVRRAAHAPTHFGAITPATLLGATAGLAIMYLTALMI